MPFDPLKFYDVRNRQNIFEKKMYDINIIHQALRNFDEVKYVEKYHKEGPGKENLNANIDKRRADVSTEIEEAKVDPDRKREYPRIVAQRKVRDCFAGNFAGDQGLLKNKRVGESYTITEILNTAIALEDRERLLKYPDDEGDGSKELKDAIDQNWIELRKEKEFYEDVEEREFSRSEAERRVRDCFAGTLEKDTDIFPEERYGAKATFDIFDIKSAIDEFDEKKLLDIYPNPGQDQDYVAKRKNVDKVRDGIRKEFVEAQNVSLISYGTGFIIDDGFILTDKHVVQSYLKDKEKYRVLISNKVIHQLLAEGVSVDSENDLALLQCPELNLKDTGIFPLELRCFDLLIGQSVFCFGYPLTHVGETALFVKGDVSGHKEEGNEEPLVTLNCSLRSGCSGGPVMRMIEGQIVVLGVVKEMHRRGIFEESIRTFKESIPNLPDYHLLQMVLTLIQQLTDFIFKVGHALSSTHSPFNFVNVIPARKGIDLLLGSKRKIAHVPRL